MLFSSNLFLFLFLPFVICIYYILPRRCRNFFLLVASLLFYFWGTKEFVLIMVGSILFNYAMAWTFELSSAFVVRRIFLVLTVIGDLSILFIYKYLDFAITNLNLLGFSIPLQHIALPLGISFFTFQSMSYALDVYMGNAALQKNPLNVALYVSFFPQLVAGPIVRYQTIADQIDHRKESLSDFNIGVRRFIAGFSKKILLSNNMALVADSAFSALDSERSVLFAWIGALAYSFQIFFDFSGYSDMAIGLGKMFGFHFLENFNYPYISRSVSEFWRRWHISLGQWFRDYVYFPLGGSRVASKGRLIFNLFVVWFLTGIWHGASWNFILWGLLYFLVLCFEKLSGYPLKFTKTWQKEFYRVFTLLCVIFGWVLFRAETLPAALSYCADMLGFSGVPLTCVMVKRTLAQYRYYFIACFLCSIPLGTRLLEGLSRRFPQYKAVIQMITDAVCFFFLIWSVSSIMIGSHNPFIYFNF